MIDADELQASLLSSRNADGGWPSHRGGSWTEPTALAVLALQGTRVPRETRSVSAGWLARQQSRDGGWPPCPTVSTSTWVTSLALLALAQESGHSQGCSKGALWLSDHVYSELNPLESFLEKTLGLSPSQAPGSSPWFPGTAGWVIPTAYSILALSCWSARLHDPALLQAVHRAQEYLLGRRCPDGGWNHGGSLQRSEASTSYAETTGLALLALHNHSSPSLDQTLCFAERLLEKPDSTEGLCWLLIGLAAHGRKPVPPPWNVPPRKTQDTALSLLTLRTLANGNPFLQAAL